MRVRLAQPLGSSSGLMVSSSPGLIGEVTVESGAVEVGDVDVELEIEEAVSWSAVTSVQDGTLVYRSGDRVTVTGTIEEVFEDGVLGLRVDGGLVMIESVGQPPPSLQGATLVLHLQCVKAFPVGL